LILTLGVVSFSAFFVAEVAVGVRILDVVSIVISRVSWGLEWKKASFIRLFYIIQLVTYIIFIVVITRIAVVRLIRWSSHYHSD
jgi:hypothetical protein